MLFHIVYRRRDRRSTAKPTTLMQIKSSWPSSPSACTILSGPKDSTRVVDCRIILVNARQLSLSLCFVSRRSKAICRRDGISTSVTFVGQLDHSEPFPRIPTTCSENSSIYLRRRHLISVTCLLLCQWQTNGHCTSCVQWYF